MTTANGGRRWALVCVLSVTMFAWVSARAESEPAETQPAAESVEAAPAGEAPSADEVQRQLLGEMVETPAQPPTTQPARHREAPPMIQAVNVDLDVLGVAPGAEQPKLLREGQYIVNRRGRLMPAPSGAQMLFVFEADSEDSPEVPMVLVPCQILQNMEDIVHERGQQIVFISSGQVLVYRGQNYMLPTMMKVAVDRGNLHD